MLLTTVFIYYYSLPSTVLVKLPSGEVRKTTRPGPVDMSKLSKPGTSLGQKILKSDQKTEKKEVNSCNVFCLK